MPIKRLVLLAEFETNTYLIWDEYSKAGAVIDPANNARKIVDEAKRLGFKIKYRVISPEMNRSPFG